jgi:ABC-type proline/glycine betaine transport system permease subunit
MPRLPVGAELERLIDWVHLNLEAPFRAVSAVITSLDAVLRLALTSVPAPALIAALGLGVWRVAGWRPALAAGLGLGLVWNLRLWQPAMETVSLVTVAAGLSLALGVPAGVLVAESRVARALATPILDVMQTTPSFVYLIPSVLFFGLGTVPGVLATMMFAVPPAVRLTALGVRQVGPEVVEAGEAFGCSRWQLLRKIKLPLARPAILLGVNQCIMMALSLVVIAALIGARGLGTAVIQAITRVEVGAGVEAGLAVVTLAMILDRVTRGALGHRTGRQWL